MTDARNVQRTVLENGLRVVSERMPNVRSVALGVWVEAGSRDESVATNGISHFLEHMLFKGTENRSAREIAESLESVGGSLNAFTTKELSCYSAHVLDEDLRLAIDVIADLLLHSVLEATEIEKEKQVILQEISQSKETPEEVIFELFFRSLFDGHPLAQEIHGTEANVKKMQRETLQQHLKNHYTANRTVVAAAGNLEHEELVDLTRAYFEALTVGAPRRLQAIPTANLHDRRTHDRNCQQAHFCLGGRGLAYSDTDKFPLLVLDTLLGGGMSSRLFQNVRETHGLAYSVYSFSDFLSDTGVFGIYAATEPANVAQVEALVRKELHDLRNGGLHNEEVERTKRQLKGSLLLGLEGTGSRMNRLARMEIYLGSYCSLDEVAKAIDNVTVESVSEVADRLYYEENLATVVLLPDAV